jgi:glycosyltransferase involved in cell wall biosynthesis
LIVKNEEKCLEKCLTSIKEADEIIICDTGSDDKTIEIAKNFTDKIFTDYKWEDSFCKARNHALGKATGDWILSIDADEELEENGIKEIREAIEVAEKNKLKTINCILVSDRRGDTHFFPRVFKKCPQVYWCGAIHNYLSVSESNNSNIKIFYGYSEAHARDPDRAFRILKTEVEKNPKLCREKFYLAREYFYRQDYNTAIDWYKKYLEIAWWAPEMADANYMLASCYLNLGDGSKARDYCLQALKINANFKEAIELLANLSGPGNKKRWLEFAKTATNEGILFVKGE